MIYKYIRFSTMKQEECSQDTIIESWLSSRGMKADLTFKDEGVSGGKRFTQRNLFDLINSLREGDTIVVSEVSRITRSGIGELCEIIEKYCKPKKVRLIICNVGLDINCASIDPMTEMQLYIFAAVAKMEKELIRSRTQSAIDAIKADIEENGYHITRKGKRIDTLGSRHKPSSAAHEAAGRKSAEAAKNNESNIAFEKFLRIFEASNGPLGETRSGEQWENLARQLNTLGYTTSTGLPFDRTRAYNMWVCIKRRKRRAQLKEKQI